MFMKFSKYEITAAVIFLASLITAFYVYPLLPETVAGHWNAAGEVNGYISGFWGAFIMPVVAGVLLILFIVIPRIDPRKENIEKFQPVFGRFIVLMMLFLAYIYGLTLWWNFGGRPNMSQLLAPAFAVLFYYIGVLVGSAKMNYTIGIRTPWTLCSEVVWQKTHRLGGILFRAAGIIAFFGLLFPPVAVWLVLVPVICVTVITVVYSYVEYRGLAVKK